MMQPLALALPVQDSKACTIQQMKRQLCFKSKAEGYFGIMGPGQPYTRLPKASLTETYIFSNWLPYFQSWLATFIDEKPFNE